MRLRSLGFRAQELESGPYTFLLSDSIPVAYRDGSGWYRTDRFFSKGTTRHLNQWLKNKPVLSVPHDRIVAAFEGLSVHTTERRQAERRARSLLDASTGDFADPVTELARALRAVLNGQG